MIFEDQKKRYDELLKVRKEIQKKSARRMKRNYLISMLVGVIIGIILAVFMIIADENGTMDFDRSILYIYGALLLFLVFYILQIIVHEAGHLVFGLLTGYKFVSFRIFSVIFFKKDGHLHRRKYSLKGTGGQCLMYPPKRSENGSFPFVLYNLGGGIGNLVISLLFVLLAMLPIHNLLRIIFIIMVLAGVLTALTNLIPMSLAIQNDGMNLKSILKDKNMQNAFYLQLKLNAELSEGRKITDYPPETFELPEGAEDTNMITAAVRFYSYYQKLAFHDYEAAERILSDMEAKSHKYIPALLNSVNAERLFFMVLRQRPVEEIASVYHFSRLVLAVAKTNVSIQRIRYIYEALLPEEEKRDIMTLVSKKPPKKWKESDLNKLYQDFLKVADNFPVSGEAALYVDIVDHIRNNYPTLQREKNIL